MKLPGFCALIVGLLFAAPGLLAQEPGGRPSNPGFETGDVGKPLPPSDWFIPPMSQQAGWSATVGDSSPMEGRQHGRLTRDGGAKPGAGGGGGGGAFGNLMQSIDARGYRGKRVVYKGYVRMGGGAGGRAQPWLRVDRPADGAGSTQMGFFDNMGDRAIVRADAAEPGWTPFTIAGEVAADATGIAFGIMCFGTEGPIDLDGVTITAAALVVTPADPPAPLAGRSLDNVVAFARLLGYVRHYHPSDQAAAEGMDWEGFAIAGVRAVEAAKNPEELAAALSGLFAPIAPTVEIQTSPFGEEFEPRRLLGDAARPTRVVSWRHRGFGQAKGVAHQIYGSERMYRAVEEGEKPGLISPSAREPLTAELPEGVFCRVPLAVYVEGETTLPVVEAGKSVAGSQMPEGYRPSANERATRLAAVALAWNVFQHFYPYFEVTPCDWRAELRKALAAAAADESPRAFLDTLRGMVSQLHDGHGYVGHASDAGMYALPFAMAWVGEGLVVTRLPADWPEAVRPGDCILRIDGQNTTDLFARERMLVSSATPQHARSRVLGTIGVSEGPAVRVLLCQRPDGSRYSATVTSVMRGEVPVEPRPEKIAEVRPGVWYVDIDRINDNDFKAALPQLRKATGLVFDLRGYPGRLSTIVLSHLTDEPIRCAWWNVPVYNFPDRVNVRWDVSNWPVPPAKPRLTGNAAFIIDGRAISYAETYMGIVEHFDLAKIVGEATAGTNGNVNPISLPGGYTIMWTGMKVLKHDGSRHHGIGILPTHPVSRTVKGIAEGKDELLEAAISEVFSEPAVETGETNAKP